jgi:predicted HTH domain antitoxin
MQLSVVIPDSVADAAQSNRDEFMQEARLAMAAKLYEMGRLSSGLAAKLADMPRTVFLMELARLHVPLMALDASELDQDLANA